MKQLTTKMKILYIAMALIIIAGIAVVAVKGFNVELKYRHHQKIELNIGEEVKIEEIQKIADEVFGKNKSNVQIIEVYKDAVQIASTEISEEQKNAVVQKVNELYPQEAAEGKEATVLIKAENVKIITNTNIRLRDVVSPYIIPMITIAIVVLVYLSIRYRKLGIVKSIVEPAVILVLTQVILLSVLAIVRFPMGRLTMPLVLIVYIVSIIFVTEKAVYETAMMKMKNEDKKK